MATPLALEPKFPVRITRRVNSRTRGDLAEGRVYELPESEANRIVYRTGCGVFVEDGLETPEHDPDQGKDILGREPDEVARLAKQLKGSRKRRKRQTRMVTSEMAETGSIE